MLRWPEAVHTAQLNLPHAPDLGPRKLPTSSRVTVVPEKQSEYMASISLLSRAT